MHKSFKIMRTNKTCFTLKFENLFLIPISVLLMVLLFAPKVQAKLFFSDININGIAQDKVTLLGKVIDQEDMAIEGVTVKEANGDLETSTDMEGKFTLALSQPTIVTFSKAGFLTYEYEFNESDSNLVVILTEESKELIVGGFDSLFDGENENQRLIDSLKMVNDKKPLYIINGEKMNDDYDIGSLNIMDVISIVVEKDVSANEKYGINGENGVIIITTNEILDTEEMEISDFEKMNTTKVKVNDLDSLKIEKQNDQWNENESMKQNSDSTKTKLKYDNLMNSKMNKGLNDKKGLGLDTTKLNKDFTNFGDSTNLIKLKLGIEKPE